MTGAPLHSLEGSSLTVRFAEPPRPLPPGSLVPVPVVIHNGGGEAVHWSAAVPLNASYQWLDLKGKPVVRDGGRTAVPMPLGAGETVPLTLNVQTPPEPGAYLLLVSLVLEGAHWLSDVVEGAAEMREQAIVTAPAWPSELTASPGGRALRGALAAIKLAERLARQPVDPEVVLPAPTADPARDAVNGSDRSKSAPPSGVANRIRRFLGITEVAEAQASLAANLAGELAVLSSGQSKSIDRQRAFQAEFTAFQAGVESQQKAAERAAAQQTRTLVAMGGKLDELRTNNEMLSRKLDQLLEARDHFAHDLAQGPLVTELLAGARQVARLAHRETIALPGAGLLLVRNPYGFLAIPDDDLAAVAYYASGALPEPATLAIVERLLQPGDVFLDVGANVGAFTLVAARRVGPEGLVIAVEPVPGTVAALRKTLAIDGLAKRTQVHAVALGAAPGKATMHLARTGGHASLLEPADGEDHGTMEVVVVPGTDLIADRAPTLVKIDVEGWELDVLAGLEPFLTDHPETPVIVEYSPIHLARRGTSAAQWTTMLGQRALRAFVIDEERMRLTAFDPASIGDEGTNLLLAKTLPASLEDMYDA